MCDLELLGTFAPYIAFIITIGSWFLNSWLNRKNELFRQQLAERLVRRTQMCEKVIHAMMPFIEHGNNKTQYPSLDVLNSLISDANMHVQLYGSDEERKVFVELIQKMTSGDQNGSVTLHANDINIVTNTFRKQLRHEIGYENP